MTKALGATPSAIDRFFDISARSSSVRTEVIAGLTTFGTMSYVLVVNPAVMSAAGMNVRSLIIVTALASMLGTLIMALWANLPIALAPGMGGNVIFAQVVVVKLGFSYHTALTMVLIGSVLFLILSATRLRERMVLGFPESIRIGMQCGIGLLIAYIGLSNSGILSHVHGQAAFGALTSPPVLLAFIGMLVTPILIARQVPAALLVSIIIITLIGAFVHGADGQPLTKFPVQPAQLPSFPRELWLAFDFRDFFSHVFLVLPITMYFFLSDFFSATATLVGVTRLGHLIDADGNIPNGRKAYLADGAASVIGSMLGSSTVAAYVESATGVEAGGRTGLSSIVVAGLFGLSLFFWPVFSIIPAQATGPTLVMVGILMLYGMRSLDFSVPENAIPPFLILIITAVTTDFMMGLASACFTFSLVAAARSAWHKLTPALLIVDAVFIVYIILALKVSG
jgi:AGZA family xanthine/uracil permease-like MFS transporter